jgi:hypothetical protein
MTVGQYDEARAARGTNVACAVLFGSAALGAGSGVVVPGWWLESVYGETTAP